MSNLLVGITFADIVVIIGYFVITVLLGLAAMRRIRNQEDYFLGGRRFGKVLQVFSAFGQATSSESAVGAVTTTYRDGAGGLWSQLSILWATPFYWITAPWYRRMRLLTMGDFFHERYGSRRMAMLYSLIAWFFLVILVSLGLKAVSSTVRGITLKPDAALTSQEHAERLSAERLFSLEERSALTGLAAIEQQELERLRLEEPRSDFSSVSENLLVWTVVTIVFIYALAGGLEGAVWVESLQGSLILILSFLLIPYAIGKLELLHGVDGVVEVGALLHERLPGYFFSLFGSAHGAQFTWYFMISLSVMSTINVAVQANQFTATASSKDELTASVGFTSGTLIKRYLTVVWGAIALLCFALYHGQIRDPDLVWGHATRDLLGPRGFGLVGLMIACLFAALQSTASTLMISASSLLTKNVYEPFFPHKSERHYVTVGRATGGLFLIAAALICTAFSTLLEMMKFLWEFNAVIAATFWCGLKWRRANVAGAWASIGVGFAAFILVPVGLPTLFPDMRTKPELLRHTQERVIQQEYRASIFDVEERHAQIARFSGEGRAPSALEVGQLVQKPVVIAPVSIYWSQGTSLKDGVASGRGMFYPEMWLFDKMFDLSSNPHAANETIRYSYKIILPFVVLIIVSLLTRPDESPVITRFFLRMRTKVLGNPEQDKSAVLAAYADPHRTQKVLLFPRSSFELYKWEKSDYLGVAGAFVAVAGVVALLFVILLIGA